MPYKRTYRKRPFRRRRRKYQKIWKRKAPAPSSGITRPRVVRFKRSEAKVVALRTDTPPSGWSADVTASNYAIFSQIVTKFALVPDNADFINLFTAYRIKGLRITGYISNTDSAGYNQQLIMYWNQNWQGNTTTTLTEKFFTDRPRSKKKLLLTGGSKPAFDIYQPMRQLSLLYNSITNSDYGTVKPKWISTNETDTNHYGFNIRIGRVDGQDFTTGSNLPYPTLRLVYTWYMEFRGVS